MPRYLIPVALVATLLGGCMSNEAGPRQGIGALAGAVGGAFLGEKVGKGRGRVLATAAGTIAGAAIGSDVGRSLDRANATYAGRAPEVHGQQTLVPGSPRRRRAELDITARQARAESHSRERRFVTPGIATRLTQAVSGLALPATNSLGQWFILQ